MKIKEFLFLLIKWEGESSHTFWMARRDAPKIDEGNGTPYPTTKNTVRTLKLVFLHKFSKKIKMY